MEKILKAYQHFRSGIYLVESMPILMFNKLLRKNENRYQITQADVEHITQKVDELFQYDIECIEQKIYPISVLTPKNPFEHISTLRKVYLDGLKIVFRKFLKQTKSFSKQAQILLQDLPEYYRRNFHFQTDGYLSESSAEIYDHQVELLFKGTSLAMRRIFLKDIKAFFQSAKEKPHILEVAVGTGTTAEFLLKTFPGAKVTCLDLSPNYLKKAQKNLKKYSNVDFVQAPAEDIPFKNETFDAVVSVYLYHELPEEVRKQVISESLRVLRQGGYFGIVDSIQKDDDPRLNWAIEEFPKDFHEPFYKNYIETPMENLVNASVATLISKKIGFLTKALSYQKVKSQPETVI